MIHIEGSLSGMIANIGGTASVGKYKFKLSEVNDKYEGNVDGFPRLELGAYDLLYRCLQECTLTPTGEVKDMRIRMELWPWGIKSRRSHLGTIITEGDRYRLLQKMEARTWKSGVFVKDPGVLLCVRRILQDAVGERNVT
jgi:hypothetical protein